jgi:hypothetical protein
MNALSTCNECATVHVTKMHPCRQLSRVALHKSVLDVVDQNQGRPYDVSFLLNRQGFMQGEGSLVFGGRTHYVIVVLCTAFYDGQTYTTWSVWSYLSTSRCKTVHFFRGTEFLPVCMYVYTYWNFDHVHKKNKQGKLSPFVEPHASTAACKNGSHPYIYIYIYIYICMHEYIRISACGSELNLPPKASSCENEWIRKGGKLFFRLECEMKEAWTLRYVRVCMLYICIHARTYVEGWDWLFIFLQDALLK